MNKVWKNFFNLQKLIEKRKSLGFTQTDMGEAIGKCMNTYCDKENGKVVFTFQDIFAIKNKLQLTNEEVIEIFFKSML